MSDKILDLIWSLDIEKMNDHLPAERRSLKELLQKEKPEIKTKKNQTHKIQKKDLELVSQLIPESEWDSVKLPIVLLRRTSLDKGIFSVSGGFWSKISTYTSSQLAAISHGGAYSSERFATRRSCGKGRCLRLCQSGRLRHWP